MPTAVSILWTSLSICTTAVCCFCFLQPFWFVNATTRSALGLFGYCSINFRLKSTPLSQSCVIYGGHFNLWNLPNNAWQAAFLLYGGGCGVLCIGAFMALISLTLRRKWDQRMAIFTGYVQCVGVFLMLMGLLVFPLGLDSRFVRYHCRKSQAYNPGDCQMGWAYMLGIMGSALSAFCPFLSHFTDVNIRDTRQILDNWKTKEAFV